MTELRTCSRCTSTKLLEYFSLNVKGEYFKLCDKCRQCGRRYNIYNAHIRKLDQRRFEEFGRI